jgi:acetylornithine deacetylase
VTSHIDVVEPSIPYSITDPRHPGPNSVIARRGSVDAKASIAAQIVAVHALLAARSIARRDVLLVFVVGEEVDGVGMRSFSADLAALARRGVVVVIFGEPTEGGGWRACARQGGPQWLSVSSRSHPRRSRIARPHSHCRTASATPHRPPL